SPSIASARPVGTIAVPAPFVAGDAAFSADAWAAATDAGEHGDGGYDGPRIGAMFMQTPIMSDMEWPAREDGRKGSGDRTAVRIGYIRRGGTVPVIPEVHKKSNCNEGWYELVAGGFVCGKYATLDLNHPRVRIAPHPPNMEGPLPYQYGYNLTNGTPLYRTIPSRKERLQFEPWLQPKPKREPRADADLDAGVVESAPVRDRRSSDTASFEPDPEDGGVPWFLRDYDGGKPTVTLDELKGDGPMERRMVRGFFLALDADFKSGSMKWWKTTGGLSAPFDRIYVQKQLTDFHGVWLKSEGEPVAGGTGSGGEDAGIVDAGRTTDAAPSVRMAPSNLPVAFILWRGHKYVFSAEKKKMSPTDVLPRFSVVALAGESKNVGGHLYDLTTEGWWMRVSEGVKTKPGPPPPGLAPGEKWIDVNIKNQTLVAFEGDRAVYATLVSSGKENEEDPEKDHKTPTGTFRIREKHVAATMDGDVASDGPYSIEDVPWIMYFSGSYALHGAFWHAAFGNTKSHGCVNLTPTDARALFGWADPPLPDGWHAVFSTAEHPGTRVVVHE
ncbi:MAG: L,D-transpeptidase, partial [Polyangiaceae bacterium]